MPLIAVNIDGDRLADPGRARDELARAAAAGADGGQQTVHLLLHGYKFSPRRERHSPHVHIFGLAPVRCRKAVSWPRALGVGSGPDEPLVIGVGWEARGTLWRAYGEARRAGRGLAALIALVRETLPGAEVSVLAHSLGGRVALSALPDLAPGALARAVLMVPAEMRRVAEARLDTPAGRRLEVLHVASGENAPFDRALEWLIAPHRPGDRALGDLAAGSLGAVHPRWADLSIDCAESRAALARFGHAIPEPDRRVCHWSAYRREGLLTLYRAVLTGELPIQALRSALPRGAAAPADRTPALPALPLLHWGRRGAS